MKDTLLDCAPIQVCLICLDEMEAIDPEAPLDLFDADCEHLRLFHPACLASWLKSKHANCPVCRKGMQMHNPAEEDRDPVPEVRYRTVETDYADMRRLRVCILLHLTFLLALHILGAIYDYYEVCFETACMASFFSLWQAIVCLIAFTPPAVSPSAATQSDSSVLVKLTCITLLCVVCRVFHLSCSGGYHEPLTLCIDILACNLACSLMGLAFESRYLLLIEL